MNNWIKLSNEEFKKSKEIIGLKKGELQIKLVKSLVILDKIKEYMSLNMRVKLNEEFGETIQYKSIYSLLEEIE